MKYLTFIPGLLLSSCLFAQEYRGEAYYQQALKKFDSVRVLSPDSIVIPSLKDLDGGAAANEYLYAETKAAFQWEAAHCRNRDELKGRMEKIFGMSFDSLQVVIANYGEVYLAWLYARHLYPPAVQERFLYHRLDWYAQYGSLSDARHYLSDLEENFPRSKFLHDGRATVKAMESKAANGKNNAHIVFRRAVHSLDELIAPYKGRVVYLDIWGTWCPPCREEMKYAPALKQHVDTAKVVFLYLDMDADKEEVNWREYVQLNDIAGEHVRMTRDEIAVIWEALLRGSSEKPVYPGFFIFGRDGKLVETRAKRPSETEALYQQLKEAVDAP